MIKNSNPNQVKLNKESLADQIFEVVRKRIIDLNILPGEKIDVEALADGFDVSKAPVRDAMKALSGRGLISIEPRVGYYARELDSGDIQDIYDMRELFEVYALDEVIDKVPKDLIEKCQQDSIKIKENSLSVEKRRKWFDQTDETLHQEIILGHSKNVFLKDFTTRIHDLISLTRHLNKRISQAIEEHLDILTALKQRDKAKAKQSLEYHLQRVRQETLRAIEDDFKTDPDLQRGGGK